MNDSNSLAHTKWNCKYHVVFAPKYRRKVFYKEKRVEIGKILRMLCGVEKRKNHSRSMSTSTSICLYKIPPKERSSFMGYLKQKKAA